MEGPCACHVSKRWWIIGPVRTTSSGPSSTSSTPHRWHLRRQHLELSQLVTATRCINVDDLFDVFTARHSFGSSNLQQPIATLTSATAMHKLSASFFLIIFTALIYFVDMLYMFFLLFWSLPLIMLGGLAMPTRRSPDLRVQNFYLVLCPPFDMLRGLV
jgi:ABC-type multidrug transport system fused ATPase/permease subunit